MAAQNSRGSSELLQRLQNLRIVGLLPKLVNLHPSDLALRVHNEHRAIVDEGYLVFGGGKDAIIRRGFGVRPAVRSEGKLETPKRFLEGDMGENSVGTDAHDLGVQAGKPGEARLDCRQVFLSNGGKVKGVEADHHIFAAIGRKLKLTLGGARRRTEPEIRRVVSNP
jgi:hypothetical protein